MNLIFGFQKFTLESSFSVLLSFVELSTADNPVQPVEVRAGRSGTLRPSRVQHDRTVVT